MKKNFRLIIGLLILVVMVFVTFNINQLENEIIEKQDSKLINDLGAVANKFGIWISNKTEMLDTAKDLVDNFEYEEVVGWNTLNPYLNINNDDPDVSQVYIGLKNGAFITGGQWVPPDDYDPRTRTWYIEAEEADETIISKVYVDRETGDQLVTISSPLYMDGVFVGVISADVFLNNITGYLKKQISNEKVYAYLVDGDGLIVVHTKSPELIGKNMFVDINNQALSGYFEEVKGSDEPLEVTYVFSGETIRGIIQNVEGVNWYLSVALVDEKAFFDFFHIDRVSLVFNGALILIILMLIHLIVRAKRETDTMNVLLKYESEKDFLTGAYNRRYFNLYMEECWKEENAHRKISLLMMDIDLFKDFNDTYGHLMGDDVLKAVTNCISDHVRKEDVVARYGGEEFALVLVDVGAEASHQIADKIREAVYELAIVNEVAKSRKLSISIGVVTVEPASGITVRETIDLADKALYEAKESGRNRVAVY